MANEAALVVETGLPVSYGVQDDLGVEKGAILVHVDALSVSGNSLHDQSGAGIAAQEKIANDGHNKIAVYEEGRFILTLSGTCKVGDPLAVATAANTVFVSTSGNYVFAKALEDGTDGQTINALLTPHSTGQTYFNAT